MKFCRGNRGLSLLELMISLVVAGMVFLILGGLTFIVTRAAFSLHAQTTSQLQAATASEQITARLRNAQSYEMVSGDNPGDPIKRLYAHYVLTPHTLSTSGTVMTHTIAFSNAEGEEPAIKHYNYKVTAWDSDKNPTPDNFIAKYKVEALEMLYQTEYRVLMTTSFQYRGIAYIHHNPGVYQLGDFVTEAIAKNHHLGEGVDNYAVSSATTPFTY